MLVSATLPAYGQQEPLIPVGDQMTIMVVFAIATLAVFAYLSREWILRKKTGYDMQELGSKQDREYEKYHSDWLDDFEEIGSRSRDRSDTMAEDLPDLYGIMGIDSDATAAQIKAKYRKLAKELHPDRNVQGDARDQMAELNRAYEVLSDPRLRARYDRLSK